MLLREAKEILKENGYRLSKFVSIKKIAAELEKNFEIISIGRGAITVYVGNRQFSIEIDYIERSPGIDQIEATIYDDVKNKYLYVERFNVDDDDIQEKIIKDLKMRLKRIR